ncbi:MAG: hypothetical protein FJ255_05060 [Phycisphaerae bacterium]|nr:hypothetical protein [Phycisphaerae bacterium]
MNRGRAIAWAAAGLSLAVLLTSGVGMARRIAAHNRREPPKVWAFQPVGERVFTYAQRPVSLTDGHDERGDWLLLRYGEEERRLRVTIPGNPNLPGLLPHQDWMRVLRFAESSGVSIGELQRRITSGQERDRLVLITRTPMPGSDPETYGAVNKKGWTFGFYELTPDGRIEHQQLGFPSRPRPSLTRAVRGQPAKQPSRPVIQEGTWQYQAAMQVMPTGHGPATQGFRNDALAAAGWTLPAASLSFLALIASLAVAIAPPRRRPGA